MRRIGVPITASELQIKTVCYARDHKCRYGNVTTFFVFVFRVKNRRLENYHK